VTTTVEFQTAKTGNETLLTHSKILTNMHPPVSETIQGKSDAVMYVLPCDYVSQWHI